MPLQVIGFQELAMVARDGIEPPTGTENTQVIDSTKTQKAQNTTKAGLEVHRRYTKKLGLCLRSPNSPRDENSR
jgi:hypothetical protein